MKRRFLGGTGMSVSEIALGTMMLGSSGNTDHDECVRHDPSGHRRRCQLRRHRRISRWRIRTDRGRGPQGTREDVVLATKFGLSIQGRPDDNYCGGSPRWIARAVEDSLRRLGTDHIDLYQMHRPDPHTDLDETLGALSDLVAAGKLRAIGCSTFPPS